MFKGGKTSLQKMRMKQPWIFKMDEKIFIGQAVTGCDFEKIKKESLEIINLLKEKGYHPYCTLCEADSFQSKTKKEKFKHAFNLIDKNDVFLAIVRNENKSEGMLIEIGYSLAKNKRIILMINKNVKNTYLPEMFDETIQFKDSEDLIDKIKELRLKW